MIRALSMVTEFPLARPPFGIPPPSANAIKDWVEANLLKGPVTMRTTPQLLLLPTLSQFHKPGLPHSPVLSEALSFNEKEVVLTSCIMRLHTNTCMAPPQ